MSWRVMVTKKTLHNCGWNRVQFQAIHGLFFFIFVFSIQLTVNIKICRWLDEPQPLPTLLHSLFSVMVLVFSITSHGGLHAKLSGITLASEHRYAAPYPGPWVHNSMTTNSLSNPRTTSTLLSWFCLVIWFDTVICLSNKFVMWIVKLKIKNKYS